MKRLSALRTLKTGRAKDYLRALDSYYGGVQKDMAERFNVTPSWLSRYLDLARLPDELVVAFASPHDLSIKHVTQLKPLLKPIGKYVQVQARAGELAKAKVVAKPLAAADVIKQLAAAAKGPQNVRKAEGGPGSHESIMDSGGKPILTVSKPRRGEGRGGGECHLDPGRTRQSQRSAGRV